MRLFWRKFSSSRVSGLGAQRRSPSLHVVGEMRLIVTTARKCFPDEALYFIQMK